jgi:drug/metabolite transporter (DMT)-like permease
MPNPPAGSRGELLRGVFWGLASALGSAAFLIPWKIASRHGASRHLVLVLLTSAAILNTAALPLLGSVGESARRRWTGVALWVSVALAVLTLVGNEASAAAIARISGPLLSVLQRFEVVIVGGLAWILLAERPDWAFAVGAAIAVGGIALTHGAAPTEAHASGVIYGLLAAGGFGSMVVLTRRFITAIDPAGVNALRLWLSVLLWLAWHRELPAASELSGNLLLHGALAALFGPFLSRLCLMYALRHVEARIAALCILAAPVATLALAWAFLGDVPTAIELAGGAVILAGVAIPVVAAVRGRGRDRAVPV